MKISILLILFVAVVGISGAHAQPCRRSCKSGESRDARGCCVPAAPPSRPPTDEPDGQNAAARPAKTPSKPVSEPDKPASTSITDKPASKPNADRPSRKPEPVAPVDRARSSGRQDASRPAAPVDATARDQDKTRSVRREAIRASVPEATKAPGAPPPSEQPAGNAPMRPEPVAGDVSATPDSELITQAPGKSVEQSYVADGGGLLGRRWPRWVPWAAMGTGAGLMLTGGLFYWSAAASFDSYDRDFSTICSNGCFEEELPSELSHRLYRARLQESTSRVSFAVGGTLAVAGVALFLLTRAHAEDRSPEPLDVSLGPAGVAVSGTF